MRKRLYLLLAFLWMGVCMLSAQTKNVSGRILSAENDEPIPGATVLVKGTSIGVVSDAHGHFTLKVPESATELIVSFIGMETQEVGIKANLTIRLKPANEKLDEVMVVAYGTAKKSSFTGAAEVIKNEQLEKMNVVSVTKALEGTSPGLQVMGGTGQPGSGAEIRIRGIGSLSSSSAPLYVLNGVVFDGDISSINPDDIESISVLKDAASAALYGARGANGVIMIQTKKGNAEKSTLSVKAVWGFSSRAIPEYSRIGIKDYYETSWEAYRNALVGTGQSMEKASEYAAANLINKQLGGYNNYNIPADKLISADGKVDASARLLYHDNSFFVQPMYHIERMMFVLPTLVGINGNRKVRHRTDVLYHFLVVLPPQLHFKDIELVGTLFRLFTHHVGRINTDGESCRGSLFLVQTPYLIPRGLQQFAHKVVQGDVHSSFSSGIPCREAVYISQYIFQLKGV